jgi:hypothetical protein
MYWWNHVGFLHKPLSHKSQRRSCHGTITGITSVSAQLNGLILIWEILYADSKHSEPHPWLNLGLVLVPWSCESWSISCWLSWQVHSWCLKVMHLLTRLCRHHRLYSSRVRGRSSLEASGHSRWKNAYILMFVRCFFFFQQTKALIFPQSYYTDLSTFSNSWEAVHIWFHLQIQNRSSLSVFPGFLEQCPIHGLCKWT